MSFLTPREELCLNWAAQGKTSWEIGVILGIAERTINYHIQNANQKMGVSNRQAAITRALLNGWITGNPEQPSLQTRRARLLKKEPKSVAK